MSKKKKYKKRKIRARKKSVQEIDSSMETFALPIEFETKSGTSKTAFIIFMGGLFFLSFFIIPFGPAMFIIPLTGIFLVITGLIRGNLNSVCFDKDGVSGGTGLSSGVVRWSQVRRIEHFVLYSRIPHTGYMRFYGEEKAPIFWFCTDDIALDKEKLLLTARVAAGLVKLKDSDEKL